MYKSFLRPYCVTPRMGRKPFVAVVHTLLLLTICLCLACATSQEAGVPPCPAIEMGAVADTQTDSTKVAVMVNDTTTILMSRTPLVATGDITEATASQIEGQWVLGFTVTDDAAKRVHEFSKQNVGRNLALVVDGKVHGTPRIAAAIIGNSYRIDNFNRTDAERLAAAISNSCRRETRHSYSAR